MTEGHPEPCLELGSGSVTVSGSWMKEEDPEINLPDGKAGSG